MGKVAAGKLNKRVALQRKVTTQDSFGQPVETWTTLATVWAHIKTITGTGFVNQEFQAGGTEVSRATASIRIRREVHDRLQLTHADRVVHGSVIYDIRAVLLDEEDNEYVDIGAANGANQG